MGQAIAEVFWKLHGGAFDEEFMNIANAEAECATFAFPWPDLFKDGKPEEKVAGLDVQLLRQACLQWIDVASKALATDPSADLGDTDNSLNAGQQTAVGAQVISKSDGQRKAVTAQLSAALHQKMVITAMDNAEYSPLNLTKELRKPVPLEPATDPDREPCKVF